MWIPCSAPTGPQGPAPAVLTEVPGLPAARRRSLTTRPGGTARCLHPPRRPRQLAHRPGQEPGIGRVGHVLLATPDTVLRWHRDIVRRRWAARYMRGKTGRPATRRNMKALVLRLARENPGWGYRRIHGELAGPGVRVAASTVWEILKKGGIDPAPRRTGPTWSLFLRSQAEAILACDFFTADLLDGTQAYALAVIEHASRRIRILGVTLHPTGDSTAQQGPQPDHGSRRAGAPGQVHDPRPRLELHRRIRRSPRRCRDTDRALQRPDAAHERDRRTLDRGCRREFLDRTLVWNQAHLRRTLHAYEIHRNQHRPHRSLDAAAPLKPLPEPVDLDRYRDGRPTPLA